MTNLGAYGWGLGEHLWQQVGFGQQRGYDVVDQVTLALAKGAYPVNLNHILFVGVQDHYQLELVYFDPQQEY